MTTDYLTRFFAILDISGAMFTGGRPLLDGNYWMDDDIPTTPGGNKEKSGVPNRPAYDSDRVDHLQRLT